jgi:hypothetical protein
MFQLHTSPSSRRVLYIFGRGCPPANTPYRSFLSANANANAHFRTSHIWPWPPTNTPYRSLLATTDRYWKWFFMGKPEFADVRRSLKNCQLLPHSHYFYARDFYTRVLVSMFCYLCRAVDFAVLANMNRKRFLEIWLCLPFWKGKAEINLETCKNVSSLHRA